MRKNDREGKRGRSRRRSGKHMKSEEIDFLNDNSTRIKPHFS